VTDYDPVVDLLVVLEESLDPRAAVEDPPVVEDDVVDEDEEGAVEDAGPSDEAGALLSEDPAGDFSPDSLLRAFFRASDG